MKRIIAIAITFVLVSTLLGMIGNNQNVKASTEYDYSYLRDYDYSMGNEYNNYTYMNSTDFDYNTTHYLTVFDPAQTSDNTVSLTRRFIGDIVRVNNTYYKFFFDNTDTIKLFKAEDFNYIRTIDNPTYQDRVEITLNQTLNYASYRNPTTFYYNNSLYLFVNEVSSGDIISFKSDFEGNILETNLCYENIAGYDSIRPVNIISINDTFYMFILAIDDNAGFLNDEQIGKLLYSNNLTCWEIDDNFTIDDTFLGVSNNWVYYIDYIKDNQGDYIYISYGNRIIPQFPEIDYMHHIIYNVNNTPLNTSNYQPIYYDNNTDYYCHNYIPIGNNIYRISYNFDTSSVTIRHIRGENKLPIDYTIKHKIYYNGLLESTSINNDVENLFDYVKISGNTYMPNFNETITRYSMYFELTLFDKNYEQYGNDTMLSYNILDINKQNTIQSTLIVMFKPDFVNIYDNLYGYYKSNDDYFRYCDGSLIYIGNKGYHGCSINIPIDNDETNDSIEVTLYVNPQDLGDILISQLMASPIEEKIGYIALIVGSIMGVAPLLSSRIDRKYSWIGFYLFLTGVFLLTGLGLLGLLL